MPAPQSAQFKKAVEDSRKLKQKPSDTELLDEKAKRNAWQKIVDQGVSPQDAQTRYIKLVDELKKKYGYQG
ncbi:fatty-acyl-CoA binding protein [Elsinoe australis]|uniref:Fatty-acyl-CoA binding protein n=1 Tax=Elsinoe australis TaxID=40998 RepID=A0A4U7BH61_9PEZI|nr:fatty-acyl-CoA binding protein [Elsinoe australis]